MRYPIASGAAAVESQTSAVMPVSHARSPVPYGEFPPEAYHSCTVLLPAGVRP